MSDTPAQPGLASLSKSFEPAALEAHWGPEWEKRGYGAAGVRGTGVAQADARIVDGEAEALRREPRVELDHGRHLDSSTARTAGEGTGPGEHLEIGQGRDSRPGARRRQAP